MLIIVVFNHKPLDYRGLFFQQVHKPNKSHTEIRALKCIERAFIETNNQANISHLSSLTLDQAAMLAKKLFSPGMAYHTGREISRLAAFVSEKRLISSRLDWKNPISRPTDSIRTGVKARQQREKKLPNDNLLDALAEIFANNPTIPRDIFTTRAVKHRPLGR